MIDATRAVVAARAAQERLAGQSAAGDRTAGDRDARAPSADAPTEAGLPASVRTFLDALRDIGLSVVALDLDTDRSPRATPMSTSKGVQH